MDPETQQKMLELQIMSQQMQQMQQQLEKVDIQTQDLNIMIDAVENMKKTKKGDELMVSLTPGIFAKATLEDSEKLIVNVGAGTAVEKSPDQTKVIKN
ncbi:prefoldin subunit alpha [Nanoarchaeota archaeon]